MYLQWCSSSYVWCCCTCWFSRLRAQAGVVWYRYSLVYLAIPRPHSSSAPVLAHQSLTSAIFMLAAWLHLHCGLSQSRTSKAMELIFVIVLAAIVLGISLPGDISPGSILTHIHNVCPAVCHPELEPQLIRLVCCPKCYCSYKLGNIPEVCMWKESLAKQAKICGKQLWYQCRTPRNAPGCLTPVYHTELHILPGLVSLTPWYRSDAQYIICTTAINTSYA
jgi:hypothetical protein